MKHQQGINNEQLSRKSKVVPAYSLRRCFPVSLQLLSEGAALTVSWTQDWRRWAFYLLALISDSSHLLSPTLDPPPGHHLLVKNTFCPQPGNEQPQGTEGAKRERREPERTPGAGGGTATARLLFCAQEQWVGRGLRTSSSLPPCSETPPLFHPLLPWPCSN